MDIFFFPILPHSCENEKVPEKYFPQHDIVLGD